MKIWIVALLILACSCRPIPVESSPTLVVMPSPEASRKIEPNSMQEKIHEPEPTDIPTASTEPPAMPTAVPTGIPLGDPVTINAADPRIRYLGRYDFSNPRQVNFDWSGVAIEAAFSGPSLIVLLDDGVNLYNVSIDGQNQILETVPGETRYQVAQNLPDQPHVVRLTKRTEAYVGGGSFAGFIVEAGHDLLDKPGGSERWIEFVGDSITTGYGNEGDSPNCWFTADTQNVASGYAALTADEFNADYSIVALSGLGVMRNLRAAESSSAETAIDFVDRTLALNPVLTWESEHTIPDAVVVNLGTNDFSSLPFPEVEEFAEAYIDLLERIRGRYPATTIFAVSGPLMLDPAPTAIRTAVERMRIENNDEKVIYVPIENNLDEAGADFGCDWHPNVQGHKKIAEQLIPAMAEILDW